MSLYHHHPRPITYIMNKKEEQVILYEDRISTLLYQSIIYALTIILASQIIYLQFQSIIGTILTIIGIISTIINIFISIIENIYLARESYKSLNVIFIVHKWITLIYLVINIPFLIWTVVIMIQKE